MDYTHKAIKREGWPAMAWKQNVPIPSGAMDGTEKREI
jgi:hypothetical protein